MAKKKEQKENKLDVLVEAPGTLKMRPLELRRMVVTVGGKALMSDKFPDSTKEKIKQKEITGQKGQKELRNLDREFQDAIHKLSDGTVGFPAIGFIKGMADMAVASGRKDFTKKTILTSVRIENAYDRGLVPIKYKKCIPVEHSIGHVTKRSPVFTDWTCDLDITFREGSMSEEDLINCINNAGYGIGIGAWRPRGPKGGSGPYGTYSVLSISKPE